MTPVEKMLKAFYSSLDVDWPGEHSDEWKSSRRIAMRAALCAFAEMTSTAAMKEAARDSIFNETYHGLGREREGLEAWRNVTLAAAEAGEDKPEDSR